MKSASSTSAGVAPRTHDKFLSASPRCLIECFQDAFWTRNAAKQPPLTANNQYRKRPSPIGNSDVSPGQRLARNFPRTEEARGSNPLTSTLLRCTPAASESAQSPLVCNPEEVSLTLHNAATRASRNSHLAPPRRTTGLSRNRASLNYARRLHPGSSFRRSILPRAQLERT